MFESDPIDPPALHRLLDQLIVELDQQTAGFRNELDQIDPSYRESALNLLHYLVLRRRDIRPLQAALSELGLSSLGRSEAGVRHSLQRVRDLVASGTGAATSLDQETSSSLLSAAAGRALLERHTVALLGAAPANRSVRIMVTMPSEAATRPALVHEMVAAGMDCMRINCAHNGPAAWEAMIANLRQAVADLGRPCRLMMDLAGPKLRTGPVAPGPRIVKVRPRRDEYGRVTHPARLWLTASEGPVPPQIPGDAVLHVPGPWLRRLAPGDIVTFVDARRARRRLTIGSVWQDGCWAECFATAYLVPSTTLHRRGDPLGSRAALGELPALEQAILLSRGDTLVVTRALAPGMPAVRDERGHVTAPARIGCTLPEAFDAVRPGEPIWFDDGKIGGTIVSAAPDEIEVLITHAREGGARLRAEKGINLPDSALAVSALTGKDLEDLAFVAEHADLVGLSFVSEPEHVEELQRTLSRLSSREIGIVLKIETRRAFERLPDLLLAAMRGPSTGVMIARGDLAIECGYERLAEVQEEMLWIAEAAHMPVIWATQVLETLARTGVPSRSEITDAAMGQRAECIMLNKGPYVVQAITLLDGILQRMQEHQSKKRSLLRRLRTWSSESPPGP